MASDILAILASDAGAIASIVVIDLVLSGDNAVVIGMAAHNLPAKQRRLAIVLGGAAAVALRVTFTSIAALILAVPLLQATGGLVLTWIAYKLLRDEASKSSKTVQITETLRDAVRTIVLADVIMSLDNILAVAGASHGSVLLLVFGLCLSIPILMFGSGLVAALMNRLPWAVYVGVAVLTLTSGRMIVGDAVVHSWLLQYPAIDWAIVLSLGSAGSSAGALVLFDVPVIEAVLVAVLTGAVLLLARRGRRARAVERVESVGVG